MSKEPVVTAIDQKGEKNLKKDDFITALRTGEIDSSSIEATDNGGGISYQWLNSPLSGVVINEKGQKLIYQCSQGVIDNIVSDLFLYRLQA